MAELANCPKCNSLFVLNKFRDVCQDCWKEEELAYEMVYQYIRKHENRTATMAQVTEATGVDEILIFKFIKNGKLKLAQFPNLGYPCEKCGTSIREGKLCAGCTTSLQKDIRNLQSEEERLKELRRRERTGTYFSEKNK